MNPTELEPGVRYRMPAKSKRGNVECGHDNVDALVARFVRRIWSGAKNEHWFLFVAGTGREVWLPREDIAGCEPEGSGA